jgi:hypothetical protein
MELSVEDFLEHYGVKGMKWGIRRERKPSKIFAPTTKEERKANRKKAWSKEDKQILGNLFGSVAASTAGSLFVRDYMTKRYGAVIGSVSGQATIILGSNFMFKALETNRKNRKKYSSKY